MSRLIHRLKTFFSQPATRELLAWCLPALILGLALRIALTIHMPYAYFHDDTPDFLETPDHLLNHHNFSIHSKKTFLSPIVFSIPFVLHVPALITIPVFHHLLGLLQIILVGWLCRLWFRNWKIFIVPLTLIAAANPFLLWYEHTIMAETMFVFVTLLVALAGTLYALEQTRNRFVFLTVALFLEAGARPEGKLIFGFGLFLLVLLHWREWRTAWPRFAIMAVVAIGTNFITKTSQAGLLLYTSVARLTPTELKCAPGFDPYIASVRDDLQERWEEAPSFPKVRDRRKVSEAVQRYLKEGPEERSGHVRRGANDFCMKLAFETCRHHFFYLPIHTYYKFRSVACEAPSGSLDNAWLFDKQRGAYMDASERVLLLSKGLTGITLKSDDELAHFIDTHYGEVPWFNALYRNWLAALNYLRFPDFGARPTSPGDQVPLYFLIAAIGLIAQFFRRGKLQLFHIAWGLTIAAFFYTIILTANVRPRFRFVFEPLWYVYIALLADYACCLARSLFRRDA